MNFIQVARTTIQLLLCALTCSHSVTAENFSDDFSSDSSAEYVNTDTYGSGGSFSISNGKLYVDPANGNTHTVFAKTALLQAGDFVSVTLPLGSPKESFLTVSTSNTGPNVGTHSGIRFFLKSSSTLASRSYRAGARSDKEYTNNPVDWDRDLTLYIYRDSETTYRVAYNTGTGVQVLDTISIENTATTDALFIGVEAYSGEVREFDNLQVAQSSEQVILSSFTASSTTLSQAGNVTFEWNGSNMDSVTLNGEEVTNKSPHTLAVSQSGDYTLVATNASGATTQQTIRILVGESFSIGAIADTQYADVPAGWRGGGREPEEGVNRLSHAVTEYNKRELDWVVMLGDLIDFDDIAYGNPPPGTADGEHDWSNTNDILAVWNQLKAPKYHILGNHEFYVPNKDPDGLSKPYSVYRKFGYDQQGYFTFRHKGFRFIVLMADWRYLDFDPELPEYSVAKAYYDDSSGPAKTWWNGAISLKQRRWAMEVMDESLALNEPVVCLVHDPVHTPFDAHSMLNSQEMLDILDGYPNIVMWLNGHNHSGDYKMEGRRHHLNLKGMQNNADSWYQLDFSPAEITLYKAENTTTPERVMDILRPSPTVAAPSDFSVVETGGEVTLQWGTEPAEATHVVIERRHVSPLMAELPSTAQTLAWQTISTLDSPSEGSYIDTPSNPASEYKYRLRFLDGAEGSRYSPALAPNEARKTSYLEFSSTLGSGYELTSQDNDHDGNANALEQFYGTDPSQNDKAPSREFQITHSIDGVVQMQFSYDESMLSAWDISLSHDLVTWKPIARDVDYKVTNSETWTPSGSSKNLTKVTLELMDQSSFSFIPADKEYFMKLVVTPST